MSTLVLGLGNPILGDDGVGWKVAEQIQSQVETFTMPVDVEFASLGGLSLMERMLGYSRVILVDCLETGSAPVGTVRVLLLDELEDPMAGHSASRARCLIDDRPASRAGYGRRDSQARRCGYDRSQAVV